MGVLVDEKPDMPQQCVLAAQKPNHLLRCITRQVANRLRKVVLPQYQAQVRPHLECCIWFWGPQHKKDMDLLEGIQRRATKITQRLKFLSCEDS